MTEFSLVYLRVLNSSGSDVYWDYRVIFKFGALLTCLDPITVSNPYKHKIGLVELILLAGSDLWLRCSVVTLIDGNKSRVVVIVFQCCYVFIIKSFFASWTLHVIRRYLDIFFNREKS